jgi:DNA transformation protein
MSGASPEFIEFVRELMSPLGTLSDGRFFGGHSFKSRGTQFAMIMGNTLYFCVNDHTRKDYEAKGMESFSYTTKKRRVFVRKYYAVPEDIVEEQDELVKWGTLAIDAATNA